MISGQIGAMARPSYGLALRVSLLSILAAHEFGHYLMSRHHQTRSTLPYFIPLPVPPLGTMGAAILMQGTPKNKRVLFDIGVAGPLAGMVVAIPILLLGCPLGPRRYRGSTAWCK
jgi:membrane-associated protease RseP (regulator of RpoE activity)